MHNVPNHMDSVTSSAKTRPRDDQEQPAHKRARLQQQQGALGGVTETSAPMQLANGNGLVHEDDRIGPRKLIQREEYIRLLEQALGQLGFGAVAQQLEAESGVQLEAPEIGLLRSAVMGGDFEAAVRLLGQLPLTESELRRAEFAVLEQKYLEVLEQREVAAAVACLRKQLARTAATPASLHRLAACLLAATPTELHQTAGWPGAGPDSRRRVLQTLQAVLPAVVMVAGGRLEALLEQAVDAQLARCMFHNNHGVAVSLLSDYVAGAEQIPTTTVQVLEHEDEVWHLQFSHAGSLLASGTKDGTAVIWEMAGPRRRLTKRHTLKGHQGPVVFVTWSPDDSKLATCGSDGTLRLWDPVSGACSRCIKAHASEVTAAVWWPDGRSLITGSHDSHLHQYGCDGTLLRSWKGHQINELALTADCKFLLAAPASGQMVRLHQLLGDAECQIAAPSAIISMSLASDSRHLLVHMSTGNISLWELPTDISQPMPKEPVKSYIRKKQPERTGHWIVRSCFGGCNESFVLSGSEECKVYVWHRGTGELLAELEGHSGTVNAVHWNPKWDSMFASASDDRSIHIWGLADDTPSGQSPLRDE